MINFDEIREKLNTDDPIKVGSSVDKTTGRTVYEVTPPVKPIQTVNVEAFRPDKPTIPVASTKSTSAEKPTPKKWSVADLFNGAKETSDFLAEGVKVGVQQGTKGLLTAGAAVGTEMKNWDYEALNPARQDREVTFGNFDMAEYNQRQAERNAQKAKDLQHLAPKVEALVPGATENAKAYQAKLDETTGAKRVAGEVAQAIGGMAPGIVTGAVNPALGAAVLGASAGGSSFEEAVNSGADFNDAYTYGVMSGAKEIATEKMFGGLKFLGDGFVSKLPGMDKLTNAVGDSAKKLIAKNADNVLGKFMANKATKTIIEMAKDASGEGMEEFISGLIDPYLRRASFDPSASSAELSDLVNQALVGGLTALILGGPMTVAGEVNDTREYNLKVREKVEALNVLASTIPADIRPEPVKVSSHTAMDEVNAYAEQIQKIMDDNAARIAKEASVVSEVGSEEVAGSLPDAISRDESSARATYGDSAVDQYVTQRENMIRNGYTEESAKPVTEQELDNTLLFEEASRAYQDAVTKAVEVFGTEDMTPEQKTQLKDQYGIDYEALRGDIESETKALDLSPITRFRNVLETDMAKARRVYGQDVVDRYVAMQTTSRSKSNSVMTLNGKHVTRDEMLAQIRKDCPDAPEDLVLAMYNDMYVQAMSEERKANPDKFKAMDDYERTANLRLKDIGLKLEVRYDWNSDVEAFFDKATNTIVLNGNIIHSHGVASYITAHELAHYAVSVDTEFLQDIRLAAKAIGYDLSAGANRRAEAYAESELEEEAIADFIAQMTTDAPIMEQLVEYRPTVLERISEYLKNSLGLHKHDRVARAQKREVIRRLQKALAGKPIPQTVEQKVESAVQRQVAEEKKNVASEATKEETPVANNIKGDLNKMAASLEKEYRILLENSKLTRKGIANRLNTAAQMIEKGEEQAAHDMLENLAHELNGGDLKQKRTDGVSADEASSLRKDLKGVTLHVTPEMKSEWPDYNEFRQSAAKVVKLSQKNGRKVDTVYDELRELYPWLPDVSNPADQLNTLVESASVNEQSPGLAVEQMADVEKLTEKLMSDLHELTGVESKFESAGAEKIPFSRGYKLSISPDYADIVTAWDGKSKEVFYLGTTSKALESIGVPMGSILLRSGKPSTLLEEHRDGMTKEIVAQLPEVLEHPVLILKSKTVTGDNKKRNAGEPSRLVVFGSIVDKKGEKVTVVAELMPDKSLNNEWNRIKRDSGQDLLPCISVIASAYGKDNHLRGLIQQSDVVYLNENKEKTKEWLRSVGVQFPAADSFFGPIGSVAYTDGKVKISGIPFSEISGVAYSSVPSEEVTTPWKEKLYSALNNTASEGAVKKSLSPTNSWGHKLSPAQQEYFRDSKVTDVNGNLIPLYHGTMSDFYVFDRTKGNKSGNMGAGFYFTNNEEDVWKHYANPDGPDLQQKIELMAERLMDLEDMPEEAAYAKAKEHFVNRTEPRLIEAYVNITKPVVIGGEHSTFFDFDSGEVYDEETDSYDYDEPSGLLVDFLYALENVLEDYDMYKPDWDPLVSDLYYEAMDDGGISAYDLTQMLHFRLGDVTDIETGDFAIGEVVRQAFEDMGFDGIIDHTVSGKFAGMRLDQDTTHYIAFFPEQAKEIDNLNPTPNPDIRYSKSAGHVFYTPRGVEVVQNPTTKEYAQMRNDVYSAYPWMKESGEPPLRRTFDEKGNEYYWSSADAIHADVEPHINKQYETRTSQHWKWWERDDKDDYPIKYSRSAIYAPTFYSQMARVVEDTKQEKLGAASVIPMLKGKGVKDEEIKWTGLAEWLEGKKSVTKQELLSFINTNQMELEEEILETINYPVLPEDDLWATLEQREEIEELWQEAFGEEMPRYVTTADDFSLAALEEFEGMIPGVISEETLSEEELALYTALNRLEDGTDGFTRAAKPPRWSEYKLDGGENYREYKFKLPNSDYSNEAMHAHWGDTGVLAHARVQDFEHDGKSVLFIEEIQSDWHNEGKKKGYAPKDTNKAYEALRDLNRRVAAMRERFTTVPELKSLVDKLKPGIIDDYTRFGMAISELGVRENAINSVLTHRGSVVDFVSGKGITLTAEEVNAFDSIREEAKTLTAEQVRHHDALNNAPPDAPFRNTYQEYVLKRLLREAAENGYSYLAWTPGWMQEERWSSEYAEGYRIEYDQDIPKFLNKYGKKWGAKVEKIGIDTGVSTDFDREMEARGLVEIIPNTVEVWSIPITDSMKESVLYEGQPKYSKAFTSDDIQKLWEKYKAEYGTKDRTGEVPEQINKDTRVSDFMESAYMAAEGNEEMQDRLKTRIVTGEGSYVPITDKHSVERAKRRIARSESDATGYWNSKIHESKRLGKDDIALGEQLLVNALGRGDLNTAEKMVADLCVEATRAGQVLQAFSLLSKLSADGRVYHVKRNAEKLQEDLNERQGDKAPKLEIDQELLDKLSKATTLEEADAIQEQIIKNLAEQVPPRISDRIVAWRYLAMLGNAKTHIRNMASNAFMLIATETKDAVGAVIEGAAKATVAKDLERTKSLKLADPATRAFVRDQWEQTKVQMTSGGKNSFDDIIRRNMKKFGNSAAGQFLNKLDKKNSDALEGEDILFKKIAFKKAMASYMNANKLTPEYLTSGTKEANTKLAQAKAYAVNEAMRAVFQESSFLASKLNEIEQKGGLATKIIVGGMLPFKKTPINVLKRGIEYTPIGILSGVADAVKKSSSGAEAIDKISCGLTGSGLFMLGMWLVSQGILRAGSGDEDNREKYYNQMLGVQDYALTIGDTTFTVDWVTPVSMPLMAGAEFWKAYSDANEDEDLIDVMGRMSSALMKSADPLTQLSMLSGLAESLGEFGEGGIGAVAKGAAESYITQFVPTLGGQVARSVDNTRRSTYVPYDDPMRWAKTLGNKVQAKTLPGGLSVGGKQVIEPLEPYVDMWGREQGYGDDIFGRIASQTLAPWYAKKVNRTAVDDQLTKLYDRTGEVTILPQSPARYYTDVNEKRHYVSAKDYTEMQKAAGQMKYAALDDLFKSSVYQKMSDEEKVSLISSIHTYANNVAKEDWAEKNGIAITKNSTAAKIDKLVSTGVSVGDAFAIRAKLSDIGGDDAKEKRISYLNSNTRLTGKQKREFMLSINKEYKNLPW